MIAHPRSACGAPPQGGGAGGRAEPVHGARLVAVEQRLRSLTEQVREGALPRRVFIARLGAWGIAAPMASLLLLDAGIAQPAPAFDYKPSKRGGGGALKLLLWQGPTLLNPHFGTGAKDQEGCCLFYEPLVRYGVDGSAEPVLAAAVPTRANGGIAADGRSVTWKLKAGVTWHDGQPFDADDVIFNWQYATDPKTAAVTAGSYDGIKAIEKIDALTVRVVFKNPTALSLRGSAPLLIPRHLFAPFKGDKSRDAPGNLKPVGTGAYRFAEFKPGDLLRGVLNPTYHQANKPHFDTVEVKGGGDPVSAARAVMQTGEFDFAWNLQLEDEVLRRLEATGKGSAVFSPGGDTEMIFLNFADPNAEVDGERASPKSRNPVLGDAAVRRALSLLLDRTSIQQGIYGRGGVVTSNVINNPQPLNSPNTKAEFGIERANALLDAAGWVRGEGGVRAKGGQRIKLLFQTSTNPVRQKVQAVLKQACAKAGIELELKAVTASVFFSSDVGNPDTSSKFWADLQMFANAGREPDPWRMLNYWAGWEISSKANKWQGLNRGRWVNAEFDALLKAAATELDTVKRTAMFIRMNDIVCSEVAAIPVVYRPAVSGLARGLMAPLSGWDSQLSSIADWYRTP